MEFTIENTQVYGLDEAIINSGNSYRTAFRDINDYNSKDDVRASRLGSVAPGTGHDSFLNGITVTMNITAPLYWWKQAQRYHWLEFVSSQSTMHCITKFRIADRCVSTVDSRVIDVVQEMVDTFNKETLYIEEMKNKNESLSEDFKENHNKLWYKIIATLPSGFCLGASMITNYRQIKTMVKQRTGHRLKEWKVFIDWANTLPKFKELTSCIDSTAKN